jgi:hypothetical protein
MHIDPTTHEQGSSGKVYSYEADFDVRDSAIVWNASVSESGAPQCSLSGTVPLTSPGIAALAEKVVRDAIVKRIDNFDDREGAAIGVLGRGPEFPG